MNENISDGKPESGSPALKSPVTLSNPAVEWVVAFVSCMIFCALMIGYHDWWRAKPYSTKVLNECLALAAFFSIALVYVFGPLHRLGWIGTGMVRFRRPLALTGSLFALFHVSVALIPLWPDYGWEFYIVKHWDMTLLGAMGMFLLGGLFSISFPSGFSRLGEAKWRRLQTWGLVVIPLILAHFMVLGKVAKWMEWFKGIDKNIAPAGTLVACAVGVVVLLLRLADWGVRRRKAGAE